MSIKVDRRIIRTRQLLRGAMLSLIRERGFDLLTVQDITERAGLNRATFYLHYADKNDLLTQMVRDTLDEIVELRPPFIAAQSLEYNNERLQIFLVDLFRHVIENAEFYRVMFSAGSVAGFANEIHESVFRVGMRWLLRSGITVWNIPPDVIISTLSGAYLGLIRWMVNQPTMPEAEVMAARFMTLVLPGITGAVSK